MIQNKLILPILLAVVISIAIPTAFAVTTTDTLFGCSPPSSGNKIHQLNKTDASSISNQTIVVAGLTVQGCNGLAVDPTTGTFYAIIKHQANATDRHLVTIDPTTGIGTDIGGMGDTYATLGFLADGSLRTVAGFASPDQEQYYSVNKLTGQTTKLCSVGGFGSGTGQGLALNFDDNKIYHNSGFGGVNMRFATVDNEGVDPCGITDLGLPTGFIFAEILAMTYNTNDAIFYGYDFTNYWTMNTTGFTTLLNGSPQINEFKGLAFTLVLGADTTDPVITTTISEPIPIQQNSIFDEFEFMSCIDDTDGDITNSMSTVGTVDTSTPKSYFVDYTCTDVATNSATLLDVLYVVKRPHTGSGGTAPSTTTTAPTAPTGDGDGTSLLQITGDGIDRAFNLFDALNELFAPMEPAPTVPTEPEPTPEPEQRISIIDRIRDFFSGLFG